jgi:hypothetical protein
MATVTKLQSLGYIECRPRADWTIRERNEWFLQLEITGWQRRRIGPFISRQAAHTFLGRFLDRCDEALIETLNETASGTHCLIEEKPGRFSHLLPAAPGTCVVVGAGRPKVMRSTD